MVCNNRFLVESGWMTVLLPGKAEAAINLLTSKDVLIENTTIEDIPSLRTSAPCAAGMTCIQGITISIPTPQKVRMTFAKKLPSTRILTLMLTIAAGVSACGGGGGGDNDGGDNVAASPTDCMVTDEDVKSFTVPYQLSEIEYGADGVTPVLATDSVSVTTAGASFNGFTGLYEEVSTSTSRTYTNGVLNADSATGVSRSYDGVSDTAILGYGDVDIDGTTTLTPAFSIPRYPVLNVPYTNTVLTTHQGSRLPENNNSQTSTSTQTWVGIEQLTVPAGTFAACKTQGAATVDTGPFKGYTNQLTSWKVANGPYKGFPLKSVGEAFDASGKSLGRSTTVTTAMKRGA